MHIVAFKMPHIFNMLCNSHLSFKERYLPFIITSISKYEGGFNVLPREYIEKYSLGLSLKALNRASLLYYFN